MNSMGGPQNKLQAMLMGLQGNSPSNSQSGPPAQGPSPSNPMGMQQQTDPTAQAFAVMKKGLNGLADMLMQLGDSITSTDVRQMAIDLEKLGQARQSDMLKKMQLDQKLGASSGQPQQQPQSPPQGMM